jgi:FAD/FMN-containing dehydrogenase/Fe-S oxidoreductase
MAVEGGTQGSTYRSEVVEDADLEAALARRIEGEVRFDSYSRELYATDASAYRRVPVGVVFPTGVDDVVAVMRYCASEQIPVLPRGGGTSLAGQAVNEAVVLDFTKHMTVVDPVDTDRQTVRAEAGIILDRLNAQIAHTGLKFPPDPSWGDKSTLGGAIGNNSTGSHSLLYGKTDYYLEEVEAVLADGSTATFGRMSIDELREEADPDGSLLEAIYARVLQVLDGHADAIDARYPDLKRNVSGYNLDMLVDAMRGQMRMPDDSGVDPDQDPGSVNLAHLLAGSEGTLAIITAATVRLEPVPPEKGVLLLTYDDILDAMADVAPILEHGPAAVEVMDDVLLELARESPEFGPVVGLLPEGTDSVLLVEFYGETTTAVETKIDALASAQAADETRATHAMPAVDPETQAKFWKMRKSGLPILLSRTSDEKHIAYIEDTAIPAEALPEYVARFQSILADYDTFASYYAHAGPGVLHIRPLISTKTVEGLEAFEAIADRVTDLVVELGGSVSGEHGDGRARTQWNRKLYGQELWEVFREIKGTFDPDWLLNPGSVCGDHDLTEDLRFDPTYEYTATLTPELHWPNENGFAGMVELCHGCGGCRGEQSTTGGVMCPTYRATGEEIQSTRGRANLLRAAMSGELRPEEYLTETFVEEVMDLCIGCKGCAHDCPSAVDMAKMKAEVTHAYHQRHGVSLRTRMFAQFGRIAPLAARVAPIVNLLQHAPGASLLQERLLGVARERSLPQFARQSLHAWFEARGGCSVDEDTASRRVVLFPDTYTMFIEPENGQAAIEVLEAAGVHVTLAPYTGGSGRPPFSKGLLDVARSRAEQTCSSLAPHIAAGRDVVVVEPSDAVMLQSDYRDLLGDAASEVSAATYGVMEYLQATEALVGLQTAGDGRRVQYHGHCHQKATSRASAAADVLSTAGYAVEEIDSTCCGMAGSFGYEREHYDLSQSIADILIDQLDPSAAIIAASGTSCRTQLGDRALTAEHPIQLIAAALDAGAR